MATKNNILEDVLNTVKIGDLLKLTLQHQGNISCFLGCYHSYDSKNEKLVLARFLLDTNVRDPVVEISYDRIRKIERVHTEFLYSVT